ncbi:MAG: DNA primase [Sarcina sp.]
MKIPEQIIERIKEENDIVDVISENVKLKRSGKNFSGLCPFHNEKSPSFSVSQEKQIYKCFGCGEAGNVISFVMKYKNLSFVDAVKTLATRANVTIEFEGNKVDPKQKKREILFNINKQVGKYYFLNLQKEAEIKEYFYRRGLTEKTIRSFGLGYAKDGWRETLGFLKSLKLNEEMIKETGLIVFNEEKKVTYDRFRNRVIFPVFDVHNNVIGFGGRVLDDSKPKYLNSPETIVFDKGTNLYGLNFAIKSGIKDRTIIMVEGYMDCISLHQHGITNVVASLGTALTPGQGKLLRKYVDKVIISYDADVAGQKATLRGLDILTEIGLEVKVLKIPKGKDPDEFIRVNGKEAFKKLLDNAKQLIDYKIDIAKEGIDFSKEKDLALYGDRITEILANLNPVEKDIYIKKISEETKIKEQALYDLLRNKMTSINNNSNLVNNNAEFGTKLYIEPAYVKSTRNILKLLTEKQCYERVDSLFNRENCIDEVHLTLYDLIKEVISESGFDEINKHIEFNCQDAELLKEFLKIKDINIIISNDLETVIKDYIYNIELYRLNKEKETITEKLKESEKEGNLELSFEYLKKAKDIQEKLMMLKR